MELGTTGWVPIGEGSYLNKHTGHNMDELGNEYDEKGIKIYSPGEDNNTL